MATLKLKIDKALDVHFVNPTPVHFGVDNVENWGIDVSCVAMSPLS
jgi:hypothetical protein